MWHVVLGASLGGVAARVRGSGGGTRPAGNHRGTEVVFIPDRVLAGELGHDRRSSVVRLRTGQFPAVLHALQAARSERNGDGPAQFSPRNLGLGRDAGDGRVFGRAGRVRLAAKPVPAHGVGCPPALPCSPLRRPALLCRRPGQPPTGLLGSIGRAAAGLFSGGLPGGSGPRPGRLGVRRSGSGGHVGALARMGPERVPYRSG